MRKIAITILAFALSSAVVYAQENFYEQTKYSHKPIVKMKLNGKKVWVLLDTGSDYTILNVNNQQKHGYDIYLLDEAKYKVQAIGKELMRMHTVRNANFEFHETQLKGPVLAYDLSNVVASIRQRTGKEITAIVGIDMMRRHDFVIDLGNRTVSIPLSAKNKKLELAGRVVQQSN